ncbi:uncharacterized protein BDW70DRAFT_145327 [Aspergillus foveolatus]|uniref:uncharacterized protein n=1 Tax=Aspergillus foveolatus TaxID=210207 RepID=UPI003CCCF49A
MSFIAFPLKQRAPDVHSQELPNMSDSPCTVRKRTNISTISSARWTDEDRTRLWQLRQEQSHLTWNQLYNVWYPLSSISTPQAPALFDDKVSHCSSKVIGPLFPGRSRAAITQECQRMEREDAKRRKERRIDHANISTPVKRPISDNPDAVTGRLPKEPRLDDRAVEQSSDDGGDIEYDGRRQPNISRQSPNAPRAREIPLRSPSSVQSRGSQQPVLGEVQPRPQNYHSYTGVAAPVAVQSSGFVPDLSSQADDPQPRPEGGVTFLLPQATTHAVSPSIQSGIDTNQAVSMAKSVGSTSHGNITNPRCNQRPHLTTLHYSKPSNLPTQLQPQPQSQPPNPQPPNPQPTPSQSTTSQPPPQPGEPNRQYVDTLTADQCVDGVVTLLSRLTKIRLQEGVAQREENTALKIRIEKLESRLDAQSKQLSTVEMIGNASIFAMEKQMEKTRQDMNKIREDHNAAFQRLNEVCGVIEMLRVALSSGKDEQSAKPAEAGK